MQKLTHQPHTRMQKHTHRDTHKDTRRNTRTHANTLSLMHSHAHTHMLIHIHTVSLSQTCPHTHNNGTRCNNAETTNYAKTRRTITMSRGKKKAELLKRSSRRLFRRKGNKVKKCRQDRRTGKPGISFHFSLGLPAFPSGMLVLLLHSAYLFLFLSPASLHSLSLSPIPPSSAFLSPGRDRSIAAGLAERLKRRAPFQRRSGTSPETRQGGTRAGSGEGGGAQPESAPRTEWRRVTPRTHPTTPLLPTTKFPGSCFCVVIDLAPHLF